MAPRDFAARLSARADRAGVEVSATLSAALHSYYDLLFRWNRTINLTAFTDSDAAIDRLLIEPLLAAHHLPPQCRLVDLGSGGGSPAIPLALAAPFVTLTMVEVKERKAAFLREAVRHLGLRGATVETVRYEQLLSMGRPHLRAYGAVSARAIAPSAELFSTSRGLMAGDGLLLLFHASAAGEAVRQLARKAGFTNVASYHMSTEAGSVLTVCSGSLGDGNPV